jgi:putative NADH-flavin reductase
MRQDERLRVVRGNVLDPGLVESAVRGQDAVVSALGTQDPRRPSTMLSEGTENLVRAMERHGVERLVGVPILGAPATAGDGTVASSTGSSCSDSA